MSGDFDKIAKRRGFSLIVVLIISLVALAVISGIFQYSAGVGSAGRVSSSSSEKYNFLQDSVETGRTALKRMMDGIDPPPRFDGHDPKDLLLISETDDLLINVDPYGLGQGVGGGSRIHAAFSRSKYTICSTMKM